jgi:ribose 5-phosphate isomerase A
MDLKKQSAEKAAALIKDQSRIGLGAGSTMAYMVEFLKQRTSEGLEVEVLSSSFATRKLLAHQGFVVLEMSEVDRVDQYFDGCDQFDRNLHALKSGGGIHTHEKLLAAMAKEFIIVADESKWVDRFDEKFPLVVELIPEALLYVEAEMKQLFEISSMAIRFDEQSEAPVKTANGNLLLDIWFRQWNSLVAINVLVKQVVGVLETSLFYDMANKAVVGTAGGPLIVERKEDMNPNSWPSVDI